jgi:integrase/recombinase XerD
MNDILSYYVQRYFMSYLIGQHNYGSNTLSSYRDTFRLLLIYLKSSGSKKRQILITAIDKDCVLSFLKWLESDRHNSASTRNVRLAHLKSFYSYVQMTAPELAAHCDSVMNSPFTKVEKRPPTYMTEDAVGHLLHSINSESREGIRHLAILSLLYDSGCRAQELIDLKVSDIQFEKGRRIYVHGKGDKYREIPILLDTEKIIRKYIRIYRLNSGDLLFTNHRGDKLTRQGIRYILRRYAGNLRKEHPNEFEPNAHPHLLRHSKATHLVNAGVNIYNVRDFLGHSSVVTTQVYLTSNPEVTRKAIERASAKTVPQSADFYTADEKQTLMDFLDTLV